MSISAVGAAFLWMGLALLLSEGLRRLLPERGRALVPASVVAGLGLLLVGPLGLGGLDAVPALYGASVHDVLEGLPALLIDVVFASILLGRRFEAPRRLLTLAASQATFGQTIAWGQYAIGLALALLVLQPVFGVPVESGVLIEMSFQGGHGIGPGMREAFESVDFADGVDLSGALATLGLLGGLGIGTVLIGRARRRGELFDPRAVESAESPEEEERADAERAAGGAHEAGAGVDDPASVHLALLLAAVGLGWLMQQGLVALEAATWQEPKILAYIPRFPLAMIGSVLLTLALRPLGLLRVHRPIVQRIGGVALDLTIVAAIAALAPGAIGRHLPTFLVLGLSGTLWCVLCFVVLGKRLLGAHWLPRALADFGQSMGMTAAGLLLARMVDPHERTPTREAFGTKQLFFEPFVGGGIITSAALPAVHTLGALPCLGISLAMLAVSLALGLFVFRVPRAD